MFIKKVLTIWVSLLTFYCPLSQSGPHEIPGGGIEPWPLIEANYLPDPPCPRQLALAKQVDGPTITVESRSSGGYEYTRVRTLENQVRTGGSPEARGALQELFLIACRMLLDNSTQGPGAWALDIIITSTSARYVSDPNLRIFAIERVKYLLVEAIKPFTYELRKRMLLQLVDLLRDPGPTTISETLAAFHNYYFFLLNDEFDYEYDKRHAAEIHRIVDAALIARLPALTGGDMRIAQQVSEWCERYTH